MRVLLITDNHTPTGGAELYFFELKKRLQQRPDMEVYSMGFGPKTQQSKDSYVLKGLHSKVAKLIWQLFFHPWMYFKLRRQFKKIRPDIIHLHNIKIYSLSLLYAVKSYPTVQTIHDYSAVCPVGYNIHKDHLPCKTGLRIKCFWKHQVKYSRLIYLILAFSFLFLRRQQKKRIKKFFAPSPLLVDYLRNNHFHDATYIVPFKNEPQDDEFDAINAYHFFFAGNLSIHKGVYLLLEEFALAVRANPHLTLTIAGTGPEELRLRKFIQKWELKKHVFLTGWKNNLHDEYKKCAAVIFPSLWMEAFGLVITEAMSHARPIIGSNRGSPTWLIDDQKTGFIFDPLKKGDLAAKLLSLAGNVELIKQLGQQGSQKLQKLFHNDEVLGQIIQHYEELIHTSKRAP